MNFDPTNVDAIKKLARDNCKELMDGALPGNGKTLTSLGIEKYLSNEYLKSLDVETRENFLSIYDAEEKMYYQERLEINKSMYKTEFDKIHSHLDKAEAAINFQKKLNAASKHLIYLVPLLAVVLTLVDYL